MYIIGYIVMLVGAILLGLSGDLLAVFWGFIWALGAFFFGMGLND